jgi:hypothetical protein
MELLKDCRSKVMLWPSRWAIGISLFQQHLQKGGGYSPSEFQAGAVIAFPIPFERTGWATAPAVPLNISNPKGMIRNGADALHREPWPTAAHAQAAPPTGALSGASHRSETPRSQGVQPLDALGDAEPLILVPARSICIACSSWSNRSTR